jgi:2-dehydro-3-deoxyglucarate aldolase
MTLRKLRNTLKKGEPSLGSWLQIANLSVAELLQRPGFDWCTVDLEHGALEENDFYELVHVIEKYDKVPIVRLADRNPAKIARLIENGAKGLILSSVEAPETIDEIASITRFPPAGRRGVGYCKENGYGRYMAEYLTINEPTLIVAMIETVSGVENIENITSCKALDGIMIGPYDLSSSLGCPGDFSNKVFADCIQLILSKARSNGKFCGIHILHDYAAEISRRSSEGYHFLAISTDANILVEGVSSIESVLDK